LTSSDLRFPLNPRAVVGEPGGDGGRPIAGGLGNISAAPPPRTARATFSTATISARPDTREVAPKTNYSCGEHEPASTAVGDRPRTQDHGRECERAGVDDPLQADWARVLVTHDERQRPC
jgi:hypothetical protein